MQTIWNAQDLEQNKRIVNDIVKQFDNTGTVSLSAGTTTTVVVNQKVNPKSVIVLEGTNAAGKAETSTTFVSAKTNTGFTITHLSNAIVRTFDYVIFGI